LQAKPLNYSYKKRSLFYHHLAFKKFELGSSIWIYMDNKNLRLFPRDLVIKNKKKNHKNTRISNFLSNQTQKGQKVILSQLSLSN